MDIIRVRIVAETLLEARGIASLLSSDDRFQIVDAGPASRGIDAKSLDGVDADSAADVVIFSATPSTILPRRGPPVVVLLDGAAPEDPFGRNVHAWLPSHASAGELTAAIIAATQDMVVLSRKQVKRWLRALSGAQDRPEPAETLTPRELQVLRMLADGLGNKEIGSRLGISDHTAKFHVAQILGKLGVRSRAEAVAVGIRRGLLPI